MKTNQSGIAHLAAVMAVVVVGAIGGVGYYVYQQGNDKPALRQEDKKSQDDVLPLSLEGIKSTDEIKTVAQETIGTANLVGVELEQEHGTLIYKLKLSDGRILFFDAKTGAPVTKTSTETVETDDTIPAGFVAGITIDQARQTALAQRPGKTVSKIELETEEGKVVYSVRFTDGGRVDVNATDGSVVRVKNPSSTSTTSSGGSGGSSSNSGSGSSNSGSGNSGSNDDSDDDDDDDDDDSQDDDDDDDNSNSGSGRGN